MATTSWAAWTVNTLAAQLRGEINQDENAAGGTVPARVANLVRDAGITLWHKADWLWRRNQGTLTTAASTATVDAPADFAKLDQNWLTHADEYQPTLTFTDSSPDFQQIEDSCGTTEGEPRVALVERDDAATTKWEWRFRLAPTPDATYVYTYWYLLHDPWTVGTSAITDDGAVIWPQEFHIGWRLLSKARLSKLYGRDDDVKPAQQEYDDWMGPLLTANAEGLVPHDVRVRDHYADSATVASKLRGPVDRVLERYEVHGP